jgi:hypothetical protein
MTQALAIKPDQPLTTADSLAEAGRAANAAAARHTFDDYRSRKAANTLRRQDAGLALFARYLGDVASPSATWPTIPKPGGASPGASWRASSNGSFTRATAWGASTSG